ncbi:MAG TPA: 3-dehydroquinate synthase family protein [Sphingomicrobium sp.]|nr:3-dehydroquinate synthase family protein [Sphingomicrobium sp.]
MTTIRVEVPPRPYDVLVGPIEAGLDRVRDLTSSTTPILVSEPRVFALHGTSIAERLGARPILVPEGEAAKDWGALHRLLGELDALNADRDTPIIALGGGSVGDLTGLAAALFKRGCPVIHIPTTLLSQADSAIGGKTAIDAFGQKNLVGTFHQPTLVIADTALLDTLDHRQLRSGYAEVVKYGLIDDPAFFHWCEVNGVSLVSGHREHRHEAVTRAVAAKARIVAGDTEDRSGKRALLNLGHSFAHATESEAGIGTVLHGEAVAVGMCLAFRFSADLGLCPIADSERVGAHLVSCNLPTRLADVGVGNRRDSLIGWMERDKKNKGDQIALILARGIGRSFLEPRVDVERLAAFLERSP